MNCPYSTTEAKTACHPRASHIHTATGTPRTRATASWLDRLSHQWAVAGTSGRTAMPASIAAKGRTDHHCNCTVNSSSR